MRGRERIIKMFDSILRFDTFSKYNMALDKKFKYYSLKNLVNSLKNRPEIEVKDKVKEQLMRIIEKQKIGNENINKNLNENNNKIVEEENDDTILKTSINKKSNIALDKIDNTRDYHPTDIDHIEKNYSHENNSINNINFNINTNNNSNNFIEFNKIKFVLISNYGHKKYIGLTGIEFYNLKDEILRIETATAVGALPKDLQTIYNDENDERIFENVFNNYNNTNEREYMWVTKFKKTDPKTFI